jgi:hypothetical protein
MMLQENEQKGQKNIIFARDGIKPYHHLRYEHSTGKDKGAG